MNGYLGRLVESTQYDRAKDSMYMFNLEEVYEIFMETNALAYPLK